MEPHRVSVLPLTPMRIVSLACSNTEIVHALGCSHLLVGVDDHSDHPAEILRSLPRVGPDLEIDVEKVRALEPDLVLASLTVPGHETVVEGLEAAGLPHLVLAPQSLGEIYENIRLLAGRLESEGEPGVQARGEELVRQMQAELGPTSPPRKESATAPATRDSPAREVDADPAPKILIQWWPKPVISPCGRSWVNPLLDRAGARNPLAGEPRPSRPVDDAEVAELAPEAIVIAWCGVDPQNYRPDVVYGNPAFQGVPAVENRRVFCIPEAYLGRPGPRLVDGVKALRRVVAACQGSPRDASEDLP